MILKVFIIDIVIGLSALIVVYLISRIQMRGWLDTFDKYFEKKLNQQINSFKEKEKDEKEQK